MASVRAILPEIGRFAAAGLGNTLLTIFVYQLAVTVTSPLTAYVLAWCVGIAIVMSVYPKLVFKREASLLNAGVMGAIYLVAFVVGCGVTALCVRLQVPDRAIIVIAAGVTSLLSYVGGRQAGVWFPNRPSSADQR
jgi:putative flippase GtrA